MRIKFCLPGMENSEIYRDLVESSGLHASYQVGAPRPDAEELRRYGEQYDIIVAGIKERFDATILSRHSRVKLICTQSSGTDHIDLETTASLGIRIVNTPGANATPVAEYCIGAAIALAKRFAIENTGSTVFGNIEYQRDRPSDFAKSSALIVGAGPIGQSLSNMLMPFGIKQRIWTFSPQKHRQNFPESVILSQDLEQCFKCVDFVFVCIPLSGMTRELISPELLQNRSKPLYIVSVSRPNVFSRNFFRTAITRGLLEGVCLDISDMDQQYVLATQPNVILTPHLAGDTDLMERNTQSQITANIRDFLDNY